MAGWVLIWRQPDQTRLTSAGAASVIVCAAMLHSLLEYPLWYSYFLLPTAFAWGIGLASRIRPEESPRYASAQTHVHRMLAVGSLATFVGGVWCFWDYQAAANIYAPRPGAGSLDERIAYGQKMPWFGYQADYAFVTVPDDDEPTKPPHAFRRTLHNLLDARLMIAYAKSLDAAGETDKARYVVARLKEFHNSLETPFLAPCAPDRIKALGNTPAPFQCPPPARNYRWQELLPD